LRHITVKGVIENIEPLRIGAGREVAPQSPTDLTVLKFSYGDETKPVIPGSSWKGIFRATATRLARVQGIKTCSGLPKESCLKGEEFKDIEKMELSFEESVRKKLERIRQLNVCLNCKIFGSPGIASHVFFDDSFPQGEFKLGYRTMVAIDRRTGSAYPQALFTVEYIEPNTLFNFRMRTTNLPNYALGLLAETLFEIHNGLVRVGGLKSRGFGRIKFNEVNVIIEGIKGVQESTVVALDPLDEPVEYTDNGWELLKRFMEVWKRVAPKLQKR